jgi:membrane fusion protein, multidrug efflux system
MIRDRGLDRRATHALLGAALVGVLSTAGCGNPDQAAFERPPAPVTVAAAVSEDVPVYIDAVGKAAARETVSIQPQVSGPITKIHFTDGADVKAGDLLFTIDPRPYQAQLRQAEANLAEAEASQDLARITFARVAGVSDPRAVSRQDYDARKNAVDAAEAVVNQHRAAVESARLNVEYTTIRSPIDGRAGQRAVDAGNVVTANSGSLLVVQRLDPIYADFTVTETELGAVQRNMAMRALRVEARLPEEPEKPREGKLTFIDNTVQEGTATVRLRATLANSDRRFWPGRFVNVRLILDTRKDAVLIPAEAPEMSAKGPFVYVVKEDMSAELRLVTLGQRYRDRVVIEHGIEAGERVVVQGHLGVTPGGKVNVVQAGTSSTAAAQGKP